MPKGSLVANGQWPHCIITRWPQSTHCWYLTLSYFDDITWVSILIQTGNNCSCGLNYSLIFNQMLLDIVNLALPVNSSIVNGTWCLNNNVDRNGLIVANQCATNNGTQTIDLVASCRLAVLQSNRRDQHLNVTSSLDSTNCYFLRSFSILLSSLISKKFTELASRLIFNPIQRLLCKFLIPSLLMYSSLSHLIKYFFHALRLSPLC